MTILIAGQVPCIKKLMLALDRTELDPDHTSAALIIHRESQHMRLPEGQMVAGDVTMHARITCIAALALFSEALTVHNTWTIFLVFKPRDPHRLESCE